MSSFSWLAELKKRFSSAGLEYEDLYELISSSIARGRTSFPAFMYDASMGIGFSAGEGYFYSLDQDWDDPDAFDEVSFFLGEMETSSISVRDYIFLMKIAADVYSKAFPEEKSGVQDSAKRLEMRYSKFLS